MANVNPKSKVKSLVHGKKVIKISVNVDHKIGKRFKQYIEKNGLKITSVLEKIIPEFLDSVGADI